MAARFPLGSSSIGYKIKAAYASKVLAIYWPATANSVHRLYPGDTSTTIITRASGGGGLTEGRITGTNVGSAGVYFSDVKSGGLGTTEGGSCTYIASGYGDLFFGIGDPWIMGCATPMDGFNSRMSIKGETYNMGFVRPGSSIGANNVGGGDDVLGFMGFGLRHVVADPTARYRVWANGSEVTGLRTTTAPASSVTVGDASNPLIFGGSAAGTGNTRFEAECWIVATDLSDTEMADITADPSIVIEAAGGGDTTAPVLSSPTSASVTTSAATVGATTDEANGTAYVVVTLSSTAPTVAQIKAGQDAAGASVPAGRQRTATISATGAFTFAALASLASSTAHWYHVVHTDAASNDSNIVTGTFTTGAVATATIPLSSLKLGRFVGGTASFAYDVGVSYRVQVYADGLTLGSALYTGAAASTNSTGQLADITDAAFTAGTVYKVALTNQSTSETTVTELTAV
jgi:hypothetical protein